MAGHNCPNCEVIPLEPEDLPPFVIQCDECRRRGQESETTDTDWEWDLLGGDAMEAALEAMIAARSNEQRHNRPIPPRAPQLSPLNNAQFTAGFEEGRPLSLGNLASGADESDRNRIFAGGFTSNTTDSGGFDAFRNANNSRHVFSPHGAPQSAQRVQDRRQMQAPLSLQEHRFPNYGMPDPGLDPFQPRNNISDRNHLAAGFQAPTPKTRQGDIYGPLSTPQHPMGEMGPRFNQYAARPTTEHASNPAQVPSHGYTASSGLHSSRHDPNPQFREYGADQSLGPVFNRAPSQLPTTGPTPPQLISNRPFGPRSNTTSSPLPFRPSAPTNPPQPATNVTQNQQRSGGGPARRPSRGTGRRGRRNDELHRQGLCIWCRRPNPDLSRKGCPACLPGRAAYTARYREGLRATRLQGSTSVAGAGAGQGAVPSGGDIQGDEEDEEEEGDEEDQ